MDLTISKIEIEDLYCDIKRIYDNVFFAKRDSEGEGIIIDSTGKQIIPGSFKDVISTYKGEKFVVVKLFDRHIVIDKSGKQLLGGYYKSIKLCDDDLYLVLNDNPYHIEYDLIDANGKKGPNELGKDIQIYNYPYKTCNHIGNEPADCKTIYECNKNEADCRWDRTDCRPDHRKKYIENPD